MGPGTSREASTNNWEIDKWFELIPLPFLGLHSINYGISVISSLTSHFPKIIKTFRSFLFLKLYSLHQISFQSTISAFSPLFPWHCPRLFLSQLFTLSFFFFQIPTCRHFLRFCLHFSINFFPEISIFSHRCNINADDSQI